MKTMVNGCELVQWVVFQTVNPNAHNPRYGRDCHAAPVAVDAVWATSAEMALDMAAAAGYDYCPEAGRYHYFAHVKRVMA